MTHRIITGDCIEEMRNLDKVDVCIFDPPYSANVHSKSRAGSRILADANGKKTAWSGSCEVEFGFEPIDAVWMQKCALELARIVKRWVLVFSDVESCHLWKAAFEAAGLDYARTGAWAKIGPTPQFTGDRPGVGFEAVTICHPKGRKRWNGGGTCGLWPYQICTKGGNSHANDTRQHTTQKPLPLIVELVSLFSDPGETVLDCCAGSGTTGVAAVRLGRHFIGIEQQEKWATIARERCAAEDQGSDVVSYRAGQLPLLGAR